MKKAGIPGRFVVLLAAFLCLSLSAGPVWAKPGSSVECVNPGDLTAYLSTLTGADANTTITVVGPCTSEKAQVKVNGITLIGSSPPTAITGNGSSPVIKVSAQNVAIEGFSISGGTIGVQVSSLASAIIVNNTISNNTTAGILVKENSTALIGFIHDSDTVASPNTIGGSKLSDANGTGIHVLDSSSARIVGNKIEHNIGNGIEVGGLSEADIDGNTLDANSLNGIYVWRNSGVNLANQNLGTIFDVPNSTDTGAGEKNTLYGIACAAGGYVAGYQGSLAGAKGSVSFADPSCINALLSPASLVGVWSVTSSTNITNPPTQITFSSDGTATATTTNPSPPPAATTGDLTWALTGKKLTLEIMQESGALITASGTIAWSSNNNVVTYTFKEPPGTTTMTLKLARQS